MNFAYTDHAKERMAERRISKENIERALRKPDDVSNTKSGRKIARKLIKNKLLRIVYEEENGNFMVITAYYTQPERY
jgi:hypothetical protein